MDRVVQGLCAFAANVRGGDHQIASTAYRVVVGISIHAPHSGCTPRMGDRGYAEAFSPPCSCLPWCLLINYPMFRGKENREQEIPRSRICGADEPHSVIARSAATRRSVHSEALTVSGRELRIAAVSVPRREDPMGGTPQGSSLGRRGRIPKETASE